MYQHIFGIVLRANVFDFSFDISAKLVRLKVCPPLIAIASMKKLSLIGKFSNYVENDTGARANKFTKIGIWDRSENTG